MPRVDGLPATERLRARPDAPQVIVLTTFDADDQSCGRCAPGPAASCSRTPHRPRSSSAVRLVAAGEPMLSPAVTRRLIDHVADREATTRAADANQLLARLTDREKEVALALAQGKPNAEIGAELFMSIGTVKAHVTQVLMKLELNNRVQVALLAHDAGLAQRQT